MKEFTYTIKEPVGIHARPAGMLAKEAKTCQSTVTIVDKNGKSVDATRLMALMGMGIKCGDTVTVKIEGADEETAAPAISGSSVYAEGGFAVRPCAAKYRRLCATAADCGRTSAARSFHAQACLGSPNLSQQAHRPSAGA